MLYKKSGKELHSALLKVRANDTGGALQVKGGGGLVIRKGTPQ